MIGQADQPLGWFGLPSNAWGWGAGLLGLLLLLPACAPWVRRARRLPYALPLLALLAALFSALYFQFVLGGRPRIIDASTYLLQARTFASGHLTFATSEASALFRGRFLLAPPSGEPALGAIFPPGYPAVLALAVRLGDYRVLGPVLAALLTLATAALAQLVTGRRSVALLAALFSVLSAAVRYHTADTMSHGWSMLLATISLASAVALQQQSHRSWPSVALGLALGGLAATRPLTAAAVGLACALSLVPIAAPRASAADDSPCVRAASAAPWRRLRLAWFTLGLLPGLSLLALYNHALTGSALGSPQLAYYALADGPPGCFRLGLGAGCQVEHADVVRAQGGHGLTLGWMLLNTVHRLHWHALDLANAEPLLLVAWYYLARRFRSARLRPLLHCTLLLPAAYALFYFQGSYPGGGARFFSELLPALHVALAAGLLSLRSARYGVALALLGYAGHAAHVHGALPEAPPLTTTPGPEGLPTVGTDHAFNLLFVPGRIEAGLPPSVVRQTGDARRFRAEGAPVPARLEAEVDWPPVAQSALWTERVHVADACVSGGRALRLHPVVDQNDHGKGGRGWLELELSGVPPGEYRTTAWLWSPTKGCHAVRLDDLHLPCRYQLFLARLAASAPGEGVHLDRLELEPLGDDRLKGEKSDLKKR